MRSCLDLFSKTAQNWTKIRDHVLKDADATLSHFFNFIQFFGKILPNYRFVLSLRYPASAYLGVLVCQVKLIISHKVRFTSYLSDSSLLDIYIISHRTCFFFLFPNFFTKHFSCLYIERILL